MLFDPRRGAVAQPAADAAQARQLFFKLAFAIGLLVLILEGAYLAWSLPTLPRDVGGYLVGRDFLAVWLGAKLALTPDPGVHFGLEAYNAYIQSWFGADFPRHIWSYPPQRLLLIWPWAFLPYLWGYALYTVIGFALYLGVTAPGERRRDHLMLLAMAPAVVVNIWTGQNGFFTCALLLGGLLQLDRRPVLAGILFGFLSVKPQLGLLLPVMLLLTGRWRVIIATGVTIAALIGASLLAWGPEVWRHYIQDAMPVQRRVFLYGDGFFVSHMPTAFMNMRLIFAPLSLAIGAQAVVSVLALAATVWTYWRRRDPDLSLALFITATFLATPYAFNYDMVIFGWVTLILLDRSDNTALDYGVLLAVWALPFVTIAMGLFDIPGSVLPLLALGGRLVWRLRQQEVAGAAGLAPAVVPQQA